MAEFRLRTPLSESDVRQLRVGDAVWLDCVVFGVRDGNMIRVFDQQSLGMPLSEDAALIPTVAA